MTTSVRARCAACALMLVALALATAPASGQASHPYKGQSLAEALQLLRAQGLRIVFTSATVKPDLRVRVEPRGGTPREQLDELLAPHRLEARAGPGGIIQVVRVQQPKPPGTPAPLAEPGGTHPGQRVTRHEHVTVRRPTPYREDRGVASEAILDRRQIEQLHGSLVDDPVRAIQNLPRVWAIDEFRSEFTIRGSPWRHVDVTIDGMPARWLQHTAHGRGAAGSLAMLASPVLEEIALRAGAYPRRDGTRLGPQLDLRIREGSRTGFGLRGAVGGTNATLVGEGPLGGSARGSWLVALRQSYLEWPGERAGSTRAAFGFSDVLAHAAYDLRPGQQVGLSALRGASNVDGNDNPAPTEPGDGTNRATALNLAWRSIFGSSVVLTHRAYAVRQAFVNKSPTGGTSDAGWNEELGYRADVARPIAGGLLEAGAHVARTAVRRVPDPAASMLQGSSWQRAGYVHFSWPATPGLTLSPGLRIHDSTALSQRAVTSWMLGEWAFRTGWTLSASSGVSHQMPELAYQLGRTGSSDLRPERAVHVDLAVEQRVTNWIRWQATLFNREERDVLREPDAHPRLLRNEIIWPERVEYTSALRGSSRGLELLVDTRSATGLSGWAAYSYGRTRYTDAERLETFWADFDRRHFVTLSGMYPFGDRSGVGATLRAGSNFPIPGYLGERGGDLFVGTHRNRVRLPAYARLDLRGHYGFALFNRRVTLFGEALNVLDRTNVGLADGSVDPASGKATGFTDALFRRRASAGLVIEF